MATSGDMNGGGGESGGLHQPVGNRELIVITREEAGVRAHVSGATSAASFDLGELASVSAESDVVLRPLFGVSEDRVRERVAAPLADAAAPGRRRQPATPRPSITSTLRTIGSTSWPSDSAAPMRSSPPT
jgi:hypothetical protein